MEKECQRCHRTFYTQKEDAEICPDCLKAEFQVSAKPMDAHEQAELAKEYVSSNKRQQERAERMQLDYKYESYNNSNAKLRVAFALFLYGVCVMTFVLSSGMENNASAGLLDDVGQRVISLLFCAVAGVLIFSASARHPLWGFPLGFLMLASGWFLPDISTLLREEEKAKPDKVEQVVEEQGLEDVTAQTRALQGSDLDVFTQQKQTVPQLTHYAVYMTNQDSRTRAIVREALTRLLGAEYTRAYTRGEGALYVVTNIPSKIQNISRTLSRFGRLTYSAPADGVYELRFDPEKINMVSNYPAEVLSSPDNQSFVSANISELSTVDTMRIRAAAQNLGNANVKMLRREIRDTLLRVLQDPWSSDYDTYTALAEAAVVYAEKNDKQVIDACRRYFQAAQTTSLGASTRVLEYLVQEVPDEMTEPIINLWLQNPVAWNNTLARLGDRVQPQLLTHLKQDESLRTINSIIKYLKDHGTAEAIPAIRPFAEQNRDAIIRHAAQETIETLEKR